MRMTMSNTVKNHTYPGIFAMVFHVFARNEPLLSDEATALGAVLVPVEVAVPAVTASDTFATVFFAAEVTAVPARVAEDFALCATFAVFARAAACCSAVWLPGMPKYELAPPCVPALAMGCVPERHAVVNFSTSPFAMPNWFCAEMR